MVLEPLSAQSFLALVAAGVAAATLYCQLWCMVAFAPFKSMPMPLEASLGWALALVPPWLIAFELTKRIDEVTRSAWPRRLAIGILFIFATTLSIVLELGLDTLAGTPHTRSLAMQMAGQLPMALLTGGALFLRRVIPNGQSQQTAICTDDLAELVALAGRIEWIKTAGNYVEVRLEGRTRIYRITMQTLENTLDSSRFVRIHRQVIVSKKYVDRRVGSGSRASIRMKDGVTFKVGNRYDREQSWLHA